MKCLIEIKIDSEKVDDCGCVLQRTEKGLHMEECPLHTAAPTMLKALESAKRLLESIEHYGDHVLTSQDGEETAVEIMDAINKATGGGE